MTVERRQGSVTAYVACLLLCVLIGWTARFGLALRWPTLHRPDETFQNLEPAYRTWKGIGIVSWEWRDGIRSWLYPDFLYSIMQATTLLHLPQSAALPAVAAVLSVVFVGAIWVAMSLGWRRSGIAGAAICGVLVALWPDLVYFGPKPLAEVQAGNLLAIAIGLASLQPFAAGRRPLRLVSIGVLLGLTFDLRFQLAIPVALVALWAGRLDARRWAYLLSAAFVPVALLGVVDWISLGSPFQSIWKNVLVNLIENKAASYGTEPFGWYVATIAVRYIASLIPLALTFVYGAREAPLAAAVALATVGFHSLIAHKEISFVYAALPPALIVCGLGMARIIKVFEAALRVPPPKRLLLSLTIAGVVAFMSVASYSVAPFKQELEWAGPRAAWVTLQEQSDICGIGLYEQTSTNSWVRTPGYVGLQRDVPLYIPHGSAELSATKQAFNYLVASVQDMRSLTGWELVSCSKDMCVLKRTGSCETIPSETINAALARRGL